MIARGSAPGTASQRTHLASAGVCVLLALLCPPARCDDAPAARPPSPDLAVPAASSQTPAGDVLVILGAQGEPEYGRQFSTWADQWKQAAERGGLRFQLIGALAGDADSNAIKTSMKKALIAAADEPDLPLWIVMIGHGTFDGRKALFNVLGEDVSPEELAEWLAAVRRPTTVIQCASASAPFLDALSAPGRVVITSTKTPQETNYSRFGGFLAQSLADPAADVDKDSQVSLLEAFLRSARLTAEFYSGDNRLATEHPLIDDNGDRLGTRSESFSGVRPVRQPDSGSELDGFRAHQWALIPLASDVELPPDVKRRRDELELQVMKLRERKGELPEDAYYAELEPLLVELARIMVGAAE